MFRMTHSPWSQARLATHAASRSPGRSGRSASTIRRRPVLQRPRAGALAPGRRAFLLQPPRQDPCGEASRWGARPRPALVRAHGQRRTHRTAQRRGSSYDCVGSGPDSSGCDPPSGKFESRPLHHLFSSDIGGLASSSPVASRVPWGATRARGGASGRESDRIPSRPSGGSPTRSLIKSQRPCPVSRAYTAPTGLFDSMPRLRA